MSNEWTTQIDKTIAQYHMIFLDYEPSHGKNTSDKKILSDRSISCKFDPQSFLCHGIDKIQLCASCFIMQERLLEELRWHLEEIEEGYYFFPTAGNEFEKSIQNLKRSYKECHIKHNYLKDKYLTSVYETCNAKTDDTALSCDLIVDVIFDMNRHGRRKKDLDNLNAFFCCRNISIFQSLLLESRKFMATLSDHTKKCMFLKELVYLCNEILHIREFVDMDTHHPNTNQKIYTDFLDGLSRSSSIITSHLRAYSEYSSISPTYDQDFNTKMRKLLANKANWRYTKEFGTETETCKNIFRNIVNDIFPETNFISGDSSYSSTPKDSQSLMRNDLEIAMKLLNIK